MQKDDEEANLALMAATNSGHDDDDEVFSKLAHEELANAIKELICCYLSQSKNLNVLWRQYDLVIEEPKTLSIQN